MAEERCVCIKDLRPGMKNVTSTFIVIDKGRYIRLFFFFKTKPNVRACVYSVRFALMHQQVRQTTQKMAAWLESVA